MRVIHDESRKTRYFAKLLEGYIEFNYQQRQNLKELEKVKLYSKTILMGSTQKDAMNFLKKQVQNYLETEVIIVIVDYFKDSMITKAYIKQFIEKGKANLKIDYVFVEFLEQDYIQSIEDEHNHELSLKQISKYRKKVIHKLLVKQGYEKIKKGRERYVNSSLVE